MAGQTYYYLSFVILLFLQGSYGQCASKRFNFLPTRLYKYVKSVENYYRVFTDVATWKEANRTCEANGDTLFYPRDAIEYHAVASFIEKADNAFPYNETEGYGIWIGISKLVTEDFLTIDGFPVEAVFNRWGENEPNGGEEEECLAMTASGHLSDWACSERKPFICKRRLTSEFLNLMCNEFCLTNGSSNENEIGNEKERKPSTKEENLI